MKTNTNMFHSNEIYKGNCLKKTSKFPKSFMIWSCMSFKEEIAIITLTINAY